MSAEPREGWVYKSIWIFPRGFATRFAWRLRAKKVDTRIPPATQANDDHDGADDDDNDDNDGDDDGEPDVDNMMAITLMTIMLTNLMMGR